MIAPGRMRPGRSSTLLWALLFLSIATPQVDAVERVRMASGRSVEAVPKQVLVRYKQGYQPQARSRMRGMGAIRSKEFRKIGVDVVTVPPGHTIETFLAQLKNDPLVEFAEPNALVRAYAAPNDPDYSSQYYLGPNFINVEGAWDITQGTSSVVIAVLDTGVTLDHEDLENNLWLNLSTTSTSGLHGTRMTLDFNGDGDCTDPDPLPGHPNSPGSEQCAGNDPTDTNSPTYHGTRVSGIIAATTHNGIDMAGVARNCRIMGVKVLSDAGGGTYEAIIEGILYATDNGASIINMSLGGGAESAAMEAAVNYALERNVVVVAAAGNDGNQFPVSFPAALDKVIAVGATDPDNTLAEYSCTGRELDVVAPGTQVLATIAPDETDDNADGTSFATPLVSGVAALLRSLNPNLTVNQIVNYINFTATDMGPTGWDSSFGFGRLNATAALAAAAGNVTYVSNPGYSSDSFPAPNPYNPSLGEDLTIFLPASLGNSGIEIKIMNTAGELVKTLNGTNKWNGKNDDGTVVASGLYFYFAKTSSGDVKGKLTVLK